MTRRRSPCGGGGARSTTTSGLAVNLLGIAVVSYLHVQSAYLLSWHGVSHEDGCGFCMGYTTFEHHILRSVVGSSPEEKGCNPGTL